MSMTVLYTYLEILVDGVYKNKENIGSVSDVDICRRLAQFDTGHCCSLSQCSAVTMMLRQDSLQLINKLLLYSATAQSECDFQQYQRRYELLIIISNIALMKSMSLFCQPIIIFLRNNE